MKNSKNIFHGIVYFFRQSAKILSLRYKNIKGATFGGNLDPYYFIGVTNFFYIIKNKRKSIEFLKYIIPLIFIAFIQFVFVKDLAIGRHIINLIKIIICISIMLYVKYKYLKINLFEICKTFTILEVIFTLIAFLNTNNAILWRLNDYTNGLDLSRLQLFYLEPSELGFHVSIIIIILFSICLNNNYIEYHKKSIVLIAINLIILYISKSMGAIAILFITAVLMSLVYLCRKKTMKNLLIFVILLVTLCGGAGIFLSTNNNIAVRIRNTMSGKDNSVKYRVNVSLNVYKESLFDYNFIGCGFGNVNTDAFISKYRYLKLDQMIVNSFIYFWTETGILGVLYWIILIYIIIKSCLKSKSMIKYGLLIYVLLYQFVGSHFTNGLIWLIYGFIISNNTEKNVLFINEKNE